MALDSPFYFYVCQHRASNDPCSKGCHGPAESVRADWLASYEAPDGGIRDSAAVPTRPVPRKGSSSSSKRKAR